MSKEFEQISIKPGFMKHNGGLLFKTISESEYQFKTTINENLQIPIKSTILLLEIHILKVIQMEKLL